MGLHLALAPAWVTTFGLEKVGGSMSKQQQIVGSTSTWLAQ
jgi:hypothetical protein